MFRLLKLIFELFNAKRFKVQCIYKLYHKSHFIFTISF